MKRLIIVGRNIRTRRKNFWKDSKGANINSIKTRKAIKDADIVIVKFGEKYKQWNAALMQVLLQL